MGQKCYLPLKQIERSFTNAPSLGILLENLSSQTWQNISTCTYCKNSILKPHVLAHVEITCHFQSGGNAMDRAKLTSTLLFNLRAHVVFSV